MRGGRTTTRRNGHQRRIRRDIELFCETGVPRHFVIAAVDAASGVVRLVNVCDDPCAR
jgi:hypothetical protein